MKPNLRFATAILVSVSFTLAAAPPTEPVGGQVLLLDNQRVLEGEVERVGDQYRVRRDGWETLVPAKRVVAVCADLDAAYKHLRDRTDARDAAARLNLARWCDANGLRPAAAAEAQAAVELQPRSAEARALLQQLRQKAAAPAPVSLPAKPAAPAVPVAVADPIDCGAEAFKRFATKVQPVLANTCASCHAGEAAGKFRLARTFSDSSTSRIAVQQNLAATLAQIDRSKPQASPLLQRATAAHGGAATPPLRDRGVPAFKQLDEWVRMIADEAAPPVPPVTTAVVQSSLDAGAPPATPDIGRKPEFGSGNVPPKAEVIDPFDPTIFNRQHHPGGPKPTPPPVETPSEPPPIKR